MPRSGLTWSVTPTQAFGQLTTAYIAAIRNGVRAIAQRRAPEIEAWMKTNKIWVDRTGNATQTLSAEVEDVSLDMVAIVMAHGVDYGVYLEFANQGRFSILSPALDTWGTILMADVRALLR